MTSASVRRARTATVPESAASRRRRTLASWIRAVRARRARRRHLTEKRGHDGESVTDAYLDLWPDLPPKISAGILEALIRR